MRSCEECARELRVRDSLMLNEFMDLFEAIRRKSGWGRSVGELGSLSFDVLDSALTVKLAPPRDT